MEEQNADALAAPRHKLQQTRERLLQQKTSVNNLRRKLIEAEQRLTSLKVTYDR